MTLGDVEWQGQMGDFQLANAWGVVQALALKWVVIAVQDLVHQIEDNSEIGEMEFAWE